MAVMTFDIQSSAVESMSYDSDREELTIVYTGGGEYIYAEIPQDIAMAAANSDSVGKFVNQHIKGTYESVNPNLLFTREQYEELSSKIALFDSELVGAVEKMKDYDPAAVSIDNLLDAITATIKTLGQCAQDARK